MLLQAQRVSVFTFQSAVHSAHVLQCLNEQRRRDVLCDVTVVVEGRSFRAHAAVLASCSEYFHGCVAVADSKHNAVVALPDEVTVRGFEPLLQFAYTSKLLFTKENIHEIQSCAKFLGFRNLESGCFDFLIPKFCEPEAQEAVKRKRCCQGGEAKPPRSCHLRSEPPPPIPSGAPAPTRDLCLETCGPQMSSLSPDLSADVVCPMLSLADPAKAGQASQLCAAGDVLASDDVCAQSRSGLPELPCEPSAAEPVDPLDGMQPGEGLDEDCGLVSCPGARLLERAAEDEGFSERSKDEREVAEHLAKGFWSDLYAPAQAAPPSDRSDLEKSPSDFHWLKQLDLTSNPADCPFLRELGSADESNPCADAPSQSEKSPCISSLNSGDDSDDVDTDGDTEANNRRAAEIQLPFPVERISALSRSAFQQLLKHHSMTPEQLDFVHDVRRRSKNRAAAQRCRKRKMDSIHHLDGDIKTLKSEREKLLQERAELEQNLEETRQSLCRLCKSVSAEPASDQDRLHFLAKLSAPDSPASLQKDA